jgi:hypothetical protein
MENKVLIDLTQLKIILSKESNKVVGKVMKRFECSGDIASIKSNVKEIIHEWTRDLEDMILILCMDKDSLYIKFKQPEKKE